MVFKWKDAYCCRITGIDFQHRKLFEIGSRVFEVASLKDEFDHYDEIVKILEELKAYTVYHFGYEEELMQKYGYPGYENHKIEHDLFIKKVSGIERKDIDGAQKETIFEIISFIADWIAGHILKTDMAYRDFFLARGLS